MIAVIDYGSGNLRSVAKALESVGGEQVVICNDPNQARRADRLVLPGVGAFADCYNNLKSSNLLEPVWHHIESERPFLGICVGMQLLFSEGREFGIHPGLDLIPGPVVPFAKDMTDPTDPDRHLKVPHMGWNQVRQEQVHPMWEAIPEATFFYFVHSYYGIPMDPKCIAGSTDYGVRFAAAVTRNNLFGTQFHPEKSQKFGLQLLTNFVTWNP